MLTAPHQSRVGERRVDQKIVKVERQMPRNSPREQKHHGWSTSYLVLAKEQGNKKTAPLCIKGIGRKILINTDLWLTRNITYI